MATLLKQVISMTENRLVSLEFNRYRLVDSSIPIEIYLGKNERNQDSLLFLIQQDFPLELAPRLTSTEVMTVFINKRQASGDWVLAFDLQDEMYHAIFCSFAENMVTFMKEPANYKKPFDAIADRYGQWQKLMRSHRDGLLSINEARGLIAELLVMRDVLTPKYGKSKAVASWKGPIGADQDFQFDDVWYEVKSVPTGKNSVKISSLEQLDSSVFDKGVLVVVFIDMTIPADARAITLKRLIDSIYFSLEGQDRYIFESRLADAGYFARPEYESGGYVVRQSSIVLYAIDKSSPVLRRSSVPISIVEAEYELSLVALNRA